LSLQQKPINTTLQNSVEKGLM